MTEPTVVETWHVLHHGLLVLESRDPASGQEDFFRLQSTREVTPEDLRTHDGRRLALMDRMVRVWAPVFLLGRLLLAVLVVATVLGLVLGQLDSTESVGGWLFWIGLPLIVVVWIPMKVAGWRLATEERSIEREAGLAHGMADQIPAERARELIETHGCRFTQARAPGPA